MPRWMKTAIKLKFLYARVPEARQPGGTQVEA
jgi:hypothetical protein